MEEKILVLIQVFGLTPYEARIYLASVHIGAALIGQIAKAANISRTAAYPPIAALLEKGLMGITSIGKRKYYVAVQPERLRTILEQRQIALDKVIQDIVQKENIHSPQNNLDIVYFTGQNGILTAGQVLLDETTERVWYSFENISSLTSLVGVDKEVSYIRQRVQRGIRSKMILSTDAIQPWLEELMKDDKPQLRETVLISPREYPFKSTIVATKGLSLLINPGENPFAVLIRNEYIATTLISIHKVLWGRYKS